MTGRGSPGSADLRALYLDDSRSAAGWLLDPADPAVLEGLAAADGRTAESSCDVEELIADVPDLLVLLRNRHIGLALGIVDPAPDLDAWADAWVRRLRTDRPTTWGRALGTDLHALRWLVGDNHLRATGEDAELVRAADPRGAESVHGREPGPIIEERVTDGVLCLRIRQCGGPSVEAERRVEEFRASHSRHFSYDRIIVDVRGNPGGGDGFAWEWMSDHVPARLDYPEGRLWQIGDKRLSTWNYLVAQRSVRGIDEISTELRASAPIPEPGLDVRLGTDPASIGPGSHPWHGRMIVLTDKGSASAGEGLAWMFRAGLGAKVVGGRTAGCMTYGDLTPYLLPRSGLVVWIATHWMGWRDVEMVGLPVDVAVDPRMGVDEVVREFDRFYPPRVANRE